MDKQAVFNKVYKHLMAMTKPSLIGTGCAYRGTDGSMCAIGCLIAEKFYSEELEGKGVRNELVHNALVASGVTDELSVKDMFFLDDLQDIHDSHFEERHARLLAFAEYNGLKVPE